mmetsp:Transcript_4349/g.8811  ORF Transcript_4349/g.8811 Transcript_4349/m.8811 type:complete len:198 (-) Transcript_4349:313-906(-)
MRARRPSFMNPSQSWIAESTSFPGNPGSVEKKLPRWEKGAGQDSSSESLLALPRPHVAHIAATTCDKTFPKRSGNAIGALSGFGASEGPRDLESVMMGKDSASWTRSAATGPEAAMTARPRYLSLPSRPLNGWDPSSRSDFGCGIRIIWPPHVTPTIPNADKTESVDASGRREGDRTDLRYIRFASKVSQQQLYVNA